MFDAGFWIVGKELGTGLQPSALRQGYGGQGDRSYRTVILPVF